MKIGDRVQYIHNYEMIGTLISTTNPYGVGAHPCAVRWDYSGVVSYYEEYELTMYDYDDFYDDFKDKIKDRLKC